MNLASLKNNIIDSVRTTTNLYNAAKKLFWVYSRSRNNDKWRFIEFKYPLPVGTVKLKVRNNHGSDSFIVSEVFQHQCYRVVLDFNTTRILDLGANAGFTAVYFSRLFPKAEIACVEPMPNNLDILKENLELNNVNSYIFEGAVTTEDGKITMETGDKDYGNKVSDIPYGKTMSNGTMLVDGMSINTLMKELNWQHVDLLKIDIEGYEGVLLHKNNSWLSKVDTIVMEIHEGVTIDFIKEATDPYGFIYTKLQKGNWILSKKAIR